MFEFGQSRGQGRGGPRQGLGPVRFCVCPNCGTRVPHSPGVPCTTLRCPKCGSQMVGER